MEKIMIFLIYLKKKIMLNLLLIIKRLVKNDIEI